MAMEDDPVPTVTVKQNFVVLILSRSGSSVHSTVIEGFTDQLAGDAACVRIRDSEEFKKADLTVTAICFEKK